MKLALLGLELGRKRGSELGMGARVRVRVRVRARLRVRVRVRLKTEQRGRRAQRVAAPPLRPVRVGARVGTRTRRLA